MDGDDDGDGGLVVSGPSLPIIRHWHNIFGICAFARSSFTAFPRYPTFNDSNTDFLHITFESRESLDIPFTTGIRYL